MPGSITQLKGIANIGDTSLNDNLVSSTIMFFEWGMLSAGNFYNVNYPTASGAYGGSQYRLRVSEDPNYSGGQVWEAFRSNWVWESGLPYPYQPIQISGIYLNGYFLPKNTTGKYAYNINYPLGRVTFTNTVIAPTSIVGLSYSFKNINVYEATSPWFKQLQFNSFRIDDSQFYLVGSGAWSIMAQNRVQMPAIVVEAVPRRTFKPYQLGGSQFVYQDLLYHLFAETPEDRDRMMDIITFQNNRRINLLDKDAMIKNNGFPLDYNGVLQPSALCYPDLLNIYPWRRAYIQNAYSQETANISPGFFQAIVRTTMELQFPEL